MSWGTATEEPTRTYGSAWGTAPAVAPPVDRGGWVSTLEQCVRLSGSGTLAITLTPGYARTSAAFSGSGGLSVAVRQGYAQGVAFAGVGRLAMPMARAALFPLAFGADGSLYMAFRDGLYIGVQPSVAIAMAFGATGGLAIGSDDGLKIIWGPGDAPPAVVVGFAATGRLAISLAPSIPVAPVDGLAMAVFGVMP